MATHGRSLDTAASPVAVWALWSDPPTWHLWNPDVQQVTLNGGFGDGTTGTMISGGGRRHEIELANVRNQQSFDLVTSALPGARFLFHCQVTPRATGSTISQSLSMSGPLAPVFDPLMGERIAASFEPLLRGLAQKAEQSQTASTTAAPEPPASQP
jgi:hypothetical protein